jgi:hypothetical protein
MKIIFLDFDGVMCLSTEWGGRFKKVKDPDNREHDICDRMDNFNQKAVKVLNEILFETGAEIVVSSDWKLHATLEELQKMFQEYGVNKVPIALTPNLEDFDLGLYRICYWKNWNAQARCTEIKKWLSDTPNIENWVAIDDMNLGQDAKYRPVDSEWGLQYFVHTTRSSEGIKQSGIKEKIIKILNESNP